MNNESTMNMNDDQLMFESYIKKQQEQSLITEAPTWMGRMATKIPGVAQAYKAVAPNQYAQAKGQVQAGKAAASTYNGFLQQLGMSGMDEENVTGQYLINWFKQNVDQDIEQEQTAQQIMKNGRQPVQNLKQIGRAHV